MKGGDYIHKQIDTAIQQHEKLILVLSEESINSDWVAYELKKARKMEIEQGRQILFPIRLMEFQKLNFWELFDADTVTDLAAEVRQYFIPDFSKWEDEGKYQDAFQRLLNDLKSSA